MAINVSRKHNMTKEEGDKIRQAIKLLDVFDGKGLVNSSRKAMLKGQSVLFIGIGGTGILALRAIKELISKSVDKAQAENRVRYLAVDCAHNELDELVTKKVFTDEEVLKIPADEAVKMIAPELITDDRKEWVAPTLYDQVNGDVSGSHEGFQPNGASAWRMPGRVRITCPNGVKLITSAVDRMVGELKCIGTKLSVFFLCSVAGGTGSGCIVDFAYLTRHVIKTRHEALYNDARFYGYIFGPDACEGEINRKRNPKANHYAAMKEIAFFMGVNDRGWKYKFRYDTEIVDIERSIFDNCVLVDGKSSFSDFPNPPKAARDTVANAITSIMTARPVSNEAGISTLAESFFSNNAHDVSAATEQMDPHTFPRYFGYVFNASGFASVKVPIELLTYALARDVFNRLWARWNTADPSYEAAESFLNECGFFRRKKVSSKVDTAEMLDGIEKVSNRIIRQKGIFYMINLSKYAAELLDDRDKERKNYLFIEYAKHKNGEKWAVTASMMGIAKQHILKLNNSVWAATKTVLEAFRDILKSEADIMTDVEVFNKHFNSTLYWCPINLSGDTKTVNKANALMRYISSIYPDAARNKIVDRFLDKILNESNVERLTGVTSDEAGANSEFNPDGLIRDFVNEEFSDLLNENIETFLVKFFSADPAAEATVPDPDNSGKRIPSQGLRDAANEIYSLLVNKGKVLVRLTPVDIADKASSRKYITVPARCENILSIIRERARNDEYTVYESTANDEFTMIEMLQGLPAFSFLSVVESEGDYEATHANFAGIHLEEGAESEHNWLNLPNLTVNNQYEREEKKLAEAKADYLKAKDLGMIREDNNGIPYICYLKKARHEGSVTESYMEDKFNECLEEVLSGTARGITMDAVLSELERRGVVGYHMLKHRFDVLTFNTIKIDLSDYYWQTLRRMFHLWHAVKKAMPLVEKTAKLLDERKRIEERFETFAFALRAVDVIGGKSEPAIIRYSEFDEKYFIKPDKYEAELANVRSRFTGSTLHKECKEFFAFKAFTELDEETFNAVSEKINERANDSAAWNRDREHGRRLKEDYEALLTRTKGSEYAIASVDFINKAELVIPGAGEKIRQFYQDLIRVIDN